MVYVELKKATTKGKKYTMIFYDDEKKKIKTTHFGSDMSNYTIHKDDERKQRYLARHRANEQWNDYMSAGSLAKHILWSKPTITASYNDYLKKFGLKKY